MKKFILLILISSFNLSFFSQNPINWKTKYDKDYEHLQVESLMSTIIDAMET